MFKRSKRLGEKILLRYESDVSVWDDSIDYERGLAALYISGIMASYLYSQHGRLHGEKKIKGNLSDGAPSRTECDRFVIHWARDDRVMEEQDEYENHVKGNEIDVAEGRRVEESVISFEKEVLRI